MPFNLTPEIAYLIGVYFSDGCISKHGNSYRYCLSVTDKDFAENVAKCLEVTLDKKVNVLEQNRGNTRKLVYNVFTMCHDFCSWILEVTDQGSKMPDKIWTSLPFVQHKILTGFMDGDGYISKSLTKATNTYRYQIGLCSTDEQLLLQFVHLMRTFGVSVWDKPMVRIGQFANSKKPVIHYRVNVSSFIRAGCRFSINRKIERLNECIVLLPQRLDATHLRRKSGYENQIDNIHWMNNRK